MPTTTYGFGPNYGTTYNFPPLDIYASSFHMAPRSYMASGYSMTADANGDKWLYEGTVLALSTYDAGCATPYDAYSGTTVLGVAAGRYNLRNGLVPIAMQERDALLREDKCRDNGVYGTVRAGSKTALALNGIAFTKVDN